MEKENYFYITHTEDGISIGMIENIEEFLREAVEGNYSFLKTMTKDFNELSDIDESCKCILIKGSIVTPIKKQVVTQYEV